MPRANDNAVRQANALGQSIWLDSISREMIQSGELKRLVDIGVSGVTSNPTIFEKAIAGGAAYDEALVRFAESGGDARRAFESLAVDDIRDAADVLRGVYDRTGGKDGFVSIEVSPMVAGDTEGTIEEARRLFSSVDRPNVMVKVPGTPEGVPAIRQLTAEGINVNVTLLFSLTAYQAAAKAYVQGLRDYVQAGRGDPDRIASVASFFVSRVDTSVDKLLDGLNREELEDLKGAIGIANAKLAYAEFQRIFGDQFSDLASRDAQVQRPLWASTGVKNPAYPDTMYLDGLIGPNTVNTVPPATLTAFLEHGTVAETVTRDVDVAREQMERLAAAGISIDAVTSQLLTAGVKAFADSYQSLIDGIESKLTRIAAAGAASRGSASLGTGQGQFDSVLRRLMSEKIASRIWQKDASVWVRPSDGGTPAADALGWLDLPDRLDTTAGRLKGYADEILAGDFTDAVVLGMGGSSLTPEVLRALLGRKGNGLRLHVLDTVNPDTIRAVTGSLDLKKTLILVSSKSGTTIEPLTLEKHFRAAVRAVDETNVARQFVALSDTGTPLAKRGQAGDFRLWVETPPDVGGRYSALTPFGLFPAALMGLDVSQWSRHVRAIAQATRDDGESNPGLWLGAAMGSLANAGRDKVTLLTSPGLERLGLWVEQLLAESTGKNGAGLIPIATEPLYGANAYGPDRQFVYVRLEDAQNRDTDALAEALARAGKPVIRIELASVDAIAAEFFRWEFATAVASNVIAVYPFDQPHVESAKVKAREALKGGGLKPEADAEAALTRLVGNRTPPNYVALAAYLPESAEVTAAFADLRRAITSKTQMATTFGYGPRFLHSTGQLYKGGPDSVLMFAVTSHGTGDVEVPGESYTLRDLTLAQAAGDVAVMRDLGHSAALVSVEGDVVDAVRRFAEKIGVNRPGRA